MAANRSLLSESNGVTENFGASTHMDGVGLPREEEPYPGQVRALPVRSLLLAKSVVRFVSGGRSCFCVEMLYYDLGVPECPESSLVRDSCSRLP